ncbi:MAG: hypothetical protein R2708_13000 [Vicinamibacterales bacterium]
MITFRQNRRSFMSVLTSLAGAAALAPARTAAAQPAGAPTWDLKWVDDVKGTHMQVYDMADANPASAPPPLRLPRNYMDAFRDVMKKEFPDVRTFVGIAGGPAFTLNVSDRIWEKYGLGERFKITDPATKAAAVRNIFMDEPTLGVKALQARGTIFWQCNIALNSIAGQLASARKLPVDEVRADLAAGLNPGVKLVPSHVMALGLVQERGVTYVKL